VLVVAVLTSLALPATSAATITVGNTNDEGPGSLRQAVEHATPGETIIVPPGVYALANEIAIAKSVTISGHGAGDTILRAGEPTRIFELIGPNIDVNISGVTIRDGNGVLSGAGVLVREEAALTLRDVVVTGNTADADGEPGKFGGIASGGGIYNQSGTLSVIGSQVTDNRASARGGSGEFGGIAEGGGIASYGPTTIEGSTIAGNAVDTSGGQGPSDPNQFGGIAYGGGVYLMLSNADAAVSTSTISGNLADSSEGPGGFSGIAQGGGLTVIAGGADISLTSSTIAENEARGPGGKGRVYGGGLYFEDGGGGTVSVRSATIARNAVDQGVGQGGNVYYLPGSIVPTLRNTIVSGGIGPAGVENCFEKATSLGFNLDSGNGCGFGAAGDQVNANAQLGPLQNNGGPTPTIAPAATSPAVDRGAASGSGLDQRGVQRPIEFPTIPNSPAAGGDGSDIGAYELQPVSDLSLGRLKRNRRRGTASLTVTVPVPGNGTVTLSGKGLKSQSRAIGDAATITFPIIGRGAVKKALRRHGKRKVGIAVTYSPIGNSAVTRSRKAMLVRKPHRKKKGKRH
jgi:hypothetical protein